MRRHFGFPGVQIGSHVNDDNLNASKFDPFGGLRRNSVAVHPWDMDIGGRNTEFGRLGCWNARRDAPRSRLHSHGWDPERFPKLKICSLMAREVSVHPLKNRTWLQLSSDLCAARP